MCDGIYLCSINIAVTHVEYEVIRFERAYSGRRMRLSYITIIPENPQDEVAR